MPNTTQQSTKLPENVNNIYLSDFGSEQNIQIASDNGLAIGQLANLTKIVGEIYRKKLKVADLEQKLIERLQVDANVAKTLALEICGQRLLIVDDEWFEGEISKKIKELGGDVNDYSVIIEKFKEQVATEQVLAQEEALKEKQNKDTQETTAKDFVAEKMEQEQSNFDPVAETKSVKKVFSSMLVSVLKSTDYEMKIEVNSRIINLLIQDKEEHKLHRELLEILYHNAELLTDKKLDLQGEEVDPTVGSWLKDFSTFCGTDDTVSTIKKATYMTTSKNFKALDSSNALFIDRLLKFYIALKNFYDNLNRFELSDIYIFPFSVEEQQEFLKKYSSTEKVELKVDETNTPAVKKPLDIMELYQGDKKERVRIDNQKQIISQETRNEYDKIADKLDGYLLGRNKIEIVASLELLAEIGALDNVLAEDVRFQKYLFNYLKVKGLQEQENEFKSNPYQAKFIQYFLKLVYGERLGLSETESARLASNLSNIFQTKGNLKYAQLAYLDLHDEKFKWSDL